MCLIGLGAIEITTLAAAIWFLIARDPQLPRVLVGLGVMLIFDVVVLALLAFGISPAAPAEDFLVEWVRRQVVHLNSQNP